MSIAEYHTAIKAFVEAGKTMPEISRALNISRVGLFVYLKKIGLKPKSAIKDLTKEEEEELRHFLESNLKIQTKDRLTNEELAARFGCGITLIKKIKKRYNLHLVGDSKLKYTVDDLVSACQSLKFTLPVMPKRVVTNAKMTVGCFCGRPFETLVDTLIRGNVGSCGCVVSRPQKQLYEHCLSRGFVCVENDYSLLGDKEIDIYIPEVKLAIEYNGLYFHSDSSLGGDHRYHLDKFQRLKAMGIHLITVFEDEYLQRPDLVFSMIDARLGVTADVCFSRKCVFITDRAKVKAFVEAHHIQGAAGKVYLGLQLGDEIVAGMAFKKNPRLSKEGWELSRFCNKTNMRVVGAFSKLMAEFIRQYNPKEIVSLSDNRWSLGNVYSKNGFVVQRTSPPTYYYIKSRRRFHKSGFSLRCLKKLGLYKEGQTETQVMAANGYERIYDCGKITWVWRPNIPEKLPQGPQEHK